MSTRFIGNLVNDTQMKVDQLKTAKDQTQRKIDTRPNSAAINYLIKRKEELNEQITNEEAKLNKLKDHLASQMN